MMILASTLSKDRYSFKLIMVSTKMMDKDSLQRNQKA